MHWCPNNHWILILCLTLRFISIRHEIMQQCSMKSGAIYKIAFFKFGISWKLIHSFNLSHSFRFTSFLQLYNCRRKEFPKFQKPSRRHHFKNGWWSPKFCSWWIKQEIYMHSSRAFRFTKQIRVYWHSRRNFQWVGGNGKATYP